MPELGGLIDARVLAIGIVGLAVLALFALERLFPLRRPRYALGSRLLVNGVMSVLTYGTAFLLVRPVQGLAMGWTERQDFGLLHLLPDVPLVQWAGSLLLLDLTFYYWHRANHQLPFLWRFHNVHHFDPDLDVSTGFRFHPGEVALSALFRMVQIALIGPLLAAFLVYEVVFQIETFFHHSNLRLPPRLDAALSWVIVTPRMHGIHHSQRRTETNANYSTVVTLWDRLHRSLRLDVPQERVTIGVPGYDEAGQGGVPPALTAPFRRQRPYWPEET